jgi:uncharacterized protein GlcG (DUF336 family)
MKTAITGGLLAVLVAGGAAAQSAAPAPYGPALTLAQATRVADAAEAEARKSATGFSIAIVEPSGQLILFRRMDGTNYSATDISLDKARSAAAFRQPTKLWEEISKRPDGARILGLRHAVVIEGGLPLVAGGRTVGAIGVSGGSAQADGVVAAAGAAALR